MSMCSTKHKHPNLTENSAINIAVVQRIIQVNFYCVFVPVAGVQDMMP